MTGIARSIGAAALILALLTPQTAMAQFGGIFGDALRGATRKPPPASSSGCKQETARGRAVIGSVLGGIAGRTAGRAGIPYFVPVYEFSNTLTEAIACRLDPKEQAQAATATDEAVRSENGGTASWVSDTRPDVSGTSTAAPAPRMANGATCMTVTDVIIVQGEETRVDKRMCRAPGQARYTLQA